MDSTASGQEGDAQPTVPRRSEETVVTGSGRASPGPGEPEEEVATGSGEGSPGAGEPEEEVAQGAV